MQGGCGRGTPSAQLGGLGELSKHPHASGSGVEPQSLHILPPGENGGAMSKFYPVRCEPRHLIATFTKRDIVDKLPCCLHRAKDTYASVLFEAIFVDQVVTAEDIRWGGHSRDQAGAVAG